ncbi:hypothetical protein ASG11_01520 [Sphingomonas sp. Leaf357]|uniref:hypothetical protein n=1 Tax=Sphingomonas sp. Leaf357 TaxID=1736350 RepID=UPI0006F8BFE0|nr:hypothetical protein [Sphingomonas sp. Leaf357]KQS03106.1 hypothetical protein ASG11_01520 [Sphingomonas sp. Leaf357]
MASAAIVLRRTSWHDHFDPETWLLRWHRLGNAVAWDVSGQPMLCMNMLGDEDASTKLRGELDWGGNRNLLRRWMAAHRPVSAFGQIGARA